MLQQVPKTDLWTKQRKTIIFDSELLEEIKAFSNWDSVVKLKHHEVGHADTLTSWCFFYLFLIELISNLSVKNKKKAPFNYK